MKHFYYNVKCLQLIFAFVMTTQGKNNSVTLLEYVVRTYISKYCSDVMAVQDVRFPLPEPSDLERASAILFDDFVADLKKLTIDIKSCENRVKKVVNNKDNEEHVEPFKSRMEDFIKKAYEQLKDQEENLSECRLK